jgi:hypothetical protein
MSKVRMSVHRGLAELKLYDNKINSVMLNPFIASAKMSDKTIGGKTIEEVEDDIDGNFHKLIALIKNRDALKSAIVKSNAETTVMIGSQEMTVAEAIERKGSISYKRTFLNILTKQFTAVNNFVNNSNEQLQPKLENHLQSVLAEKRDVETVKQLTKLFEDKHKYILIDPCHVQNYISRLTEEVEEFSTQVDYVLSESNATTFFDVEFVD